ncbi:MAG TPA: hypothetical protein VF532_18340 [Candidatus Angelobacter sp.]
MTATADRLYNLLPTVYRLRDFDQGEPLRALLSLIEQEYGDVEQDIQGLYENWFIETCDEWVVPYIGDLLGVRALYPASAGTLSARAYVAHALDYRRRKGTAATLEQLARDVTGWPAHVVEFFQLLSTTQYLNHQRPESAATADIRDSSRLELLGGPFDPFTHTADVRHISAGGSRYNIPNIGLFLWRLQDYLAGPIPATPSGPQRQSEARAVATPADGRYTFHPLGFNAPLLNRAQTKTDATLLATEINLPGLLRRRPLYDELEILRQSAVDQSPTPALVYFGANPVFQIMVDGTLVPFDQIMVCDVSDVSATDWRRPGKTKSYTPASGGAAVKKNIALSVDPVRGRIAFPAGVKPSSVQVAYTYGFSGDLGAGSYDRTNWLKDPQTGPAPFNNSRRWQAAVSRRLTPVPKLLFATLSDALKEWDKQPANTDGVIAILDSASYREDLSINVPEGSRLLMVAADWPSLRETGSGTNLSLDPDGLRPHLIGKIDVDGTAANSSKNPGQLFIDDLLIEGILTVVAGNLGTLTLSHTTISPSAGLKVASSGKSDNSDLVVNLYRTICGPVTLSASIPALNATDSIISSGPASSDQDAAITAPGATVNIQTTTVLGTTAGLIVDAGNSICTGVVTANRRQAGCVRFSYVPDASQTARRFHCQPDLALTDVKGAAAQNAVRARLTPQFTSLDFSQPFYAQLSPRCAAEIATGAEDGAEMGAFSFLQQPQRRANLLTALDEYLRFGLEAGITEET